MGQGLMLGEINEACKNHLKGYLGLTSLCYVLTRFLLGITCYSINKWFLVDGF